MYIVYIILYKELCFTLSTDIILGWYYSIGRSAYYSYYIIVYVRLQFWIGFACRRTIFQATEIFIEQSLENSRTMQSARLMCLYIYAHKHSLAFMCIEISQTPLFFILHTFLYTITIHDEWNTSSTVLNMYKLV